VFIIPRKSYLSARIALLLKVPFQNKLISGTNKPDLLERYLQKTPKKPTLSPKHFWLRLVSVVWPPLSKLNQSSRHHQPTEYLFLLMRLLAESVEMHLSYLNFSLHR